MNIEIRKVLFCILMAFLGLRNARADLIIHVDNIILQSKSSFVSLLADELASSENIGLVESEKKSAIEQIILMRANFVCKHYNLGSAIRYEHREIDGLQQLYLVNSDGKIKSSTFGNIRKHFPTTFTEIWCDGLRKKQGVKGYEFQECTWWNNLKSNKIINALKNTIHNDIFNKISLFDKSNSISNPAPGSEILPGMILSDQMLEENDKLTDWVRSALVITRSQDSMPGLISNDDVKVVNSNPEGSLPLSEVGLNNLGIFKVFVKNGLDEEDPQYFIKKLGSCDEFASMWALRSSPFNEPHPVGNFPRISNIISYAKSKDQAGKSVCYGLIEAAQGTQGSTYRVKFKEKTEQEQKEILFNLGKQMAGMHLVEAKFDLDQKAVQIWSHEDFIPSNWFYDESSRQLTLIDTGINLKKLTDVPKDLFTGPLNQTRGLPSSPYWNEFVRGYFVTSVELIKRPDHFALWKEKVLEPLIQRCKMELSQSLAGVEKSSPNQTFSSHPCEKYLKDLEQGKGH